VTRFRTATWRPVSCPIIAEPHLLHSRHHRRRKQSRNGLIEVLKGRSVTTALELYSPAQRPLYFGSVSVARSTAGRNEPSPPVGRSHQAPD
jgi:hypothetical protein